MCHMDTGENFELATKISLIFAIRRTIPVPRVCPCICICAVMHRAHGSGHGDKDKNFDKFWLVTLRQVAHTGWCVCIHNCIGEFGMDTGQPLMTSN